MTHEYEKDVIHSSPNKFAPSVLLSSDKQSLIYTQTKAEVRRVDILQNNNLPNHLQRSNIQMTKGPHYLNASVCVHVCDCVCVGVCVRVPLPPMELWWLIVS